VHAGIKLLRTANSSFIFDRLRRSIKLCAVFLAIFLPAALVADGCFLLVPATAVVEVAAAEPLEVPFEPAAAAAGVGSSRGFIWMILRERVGGGGRANWSFCGPLAAADERLLDLTVSLACIGNPVPNELESMFVTAGGGSSKESCSEAILEPSWPLISVDDAGVGSDAPRGIVMV
jgi:hypothetical protein